MVLAILRPQFTHTFIRRCASIKRVKQEDGPSITYEAFVQDLNQGDMFCSKMMDLLVAVRLEHSSGLAGKTYQKISSGTS
jgi:hypothetical protein